MLDALSDTTVLIYPGFKPALWDAGAMWGSVSCLGAHDETGDWSTNHLVGGQTTLPSTLQPPMIPAAQSIKTSRHHWSLPFACIFCYRHMIVDIVQWIYELSFSFWLEVLQFMHIIHALLLDKYDHGMPTPNQNSLDDVENAGADSQSSKLWLSLKESNTTGLLSLHSSETKKKKLKVCVRACEDSHIIITWRFLKSF